RLPHVVRVGFESEAPDRDRLAGKLAVEMGVELVEQHLLLPPVDVLDRQQELGAIADARRRTRKRLHVLRKARTAVATPRVNEVIADTRIGADADAHALDVGP